MEFGTYEDVKNDSSYYTESQSRLTELPLPVSERLILEIGVLGRI